MKANEVIAELNNCKKAFEAAGNNFTKAQLIQAFKGCSIPTNNFFWKQFRDSGLIERISRSKFKFTSDKPIYIDALNIIFSRYQKSYTDYQKNYTRKPRKIKEVNKDTEEVAIELLKSLGYKIYKKVTTYEEI